MRSITVGLTTHGGGRSKKRLGLKSFALLRKQVLKTTFLPPMKIFNQFLMEGRSMTDGGDIMEWTPFKIKADEYADLADGLGPALICKKAPKGIQSMDEWIDFTFKLRAVDAKK